MDASDGARIWEAVRERYFSRAGAWCVQNVNALPGGGNKPELTNRNGLRIREDVLYRDAEGKENLAIRNRADRALKILGPTLQRILKPDETILYLFGAESRRGLLQMILRRFSFFADTLLVITDKRIVALRVWSGTLGMKWTGSIRSVRWADVSNAKVLNPLIPMFNLRFRNGTSDGYWKIRRYDARKLDGLLSSGLLDLSGEQSGARGAAALCPRCLQTLVPRKYRCWRCNLVFKDEKGLWLRALFIPGGAYLYTEGLGALGILSAGLELFILVVSVLVFLATAGVPLPHFFGERDTTVGPGEAVPIFIISLVLMFIFFLLPLKVLAILRCKPHIRDFIPERNLSELNNSVG